MSWRTITDWAKNSPEMLRWADRLGRGTGRFRVLDYLARPSRTENIPDLSNWENHTLAAMWIGHATVLLRVGNKTILTDPVFSSRVGLGLGLITAGPRRYIAPAIKLRQLPPIDLILISHAHFDHLDRPTLRRMKKTVPVVTAHHTRDLIVDLKFSNVTELKWGESFQLGELKITAQSVTHWGARTFFDQHRGYNAYLLESPGKRVLYAGDTAFQKQFASIGKVDLAIFGIGAYDPYIRAHATPEQAWQMANDVSADFVLPMHHSTFKLSHEPMQEPITRMLAAAGEDASRIVAQNVGDVWIGETASGK